MNINKYIFLFIIIIILIFLTINQTYFFNKEFFDNTQTGTITYQPGTIFSTQIETPSQNSVNIESENNNNLGHAPTIVLIIIFLLLSCLFMNYMVPTVPSLQYLELSSPYPNTTFTQPIIIPLTFQPGYSPYIIPPQQNIKVIP